MTARIYRPSETAMQSGGASDKWVLEYEPAEQRRIDPLTGWTGSGDTRSQVKLTFESKQAALTYAAKHGVAAQVIEPAARKMTVRAQGYAGNFATSRRVPWSH